MQSNLHNQEQKLVESQHPIPSVLSVQATTENPKEERTKRSRRKRPKYTFIVKQSDKQADTAKLENMPHLLCTWLVRRYKQMKFDNGVPQIKN